MIGGAGGDGRWGSRLRLGFSLAPGMRVGLYGGSFDPPHPGHRHVAKVARARLNLQLMIWLVTPQNPLKPHPADQSHRARLRQVGALAGRRATVVSDIEARFGLRYSVDTVRFLKARFPRVRFVWIMGADSLAGFHRWRAWMTIAALLPIAVVARPGASLSSRFSPAARRLDFARKPARAAARLAFMAPPAWIYLDAPWNPHSSTALRNSRLKAS